MSKKTKIKQSKTYFLTKGDLDYLVPRRQFLMVFSELLKNAERNMAMYIDQEVRPRLSLKQDDNISVDISAGKIEKIVEEKKKEKKIKEKKVQGAQG